MIGLSKLTPGSPKLFVPKSHDVCRLWVDYYVLRKVTVKKSYPLPRMSELWDRLNRARIFTNLDLEDLYYLNRVKEDEKCKTVIPNPYKLYEYTVIPFVVTNAAATFQDRLNEVLSEFLEQGVLIYLDDSLI